MDVGREDVQTAAVVDQPWDCHSDSERPRGGMFHQRSRMCCQGVDQTVAANAQAKVCAVAVAALLRDETPSPPKLINTCYSLVAPDYGISIAGVYHPVNGQLADVEGAGGVSPADAPPDFRALEATYAEAWFRTITAQTFG